MANNNSENCQPCAPVPTVPTAQPPTCPAVPPCDEVILSDCVISTVQGACTATYIPPSDPLLDIEVGLSIQQGTTLTEVYQQLVGLNGSACIFNPNVIGAMLQIVGSNADLTQVFCELVCACTCDDGCGDVIGVTQAVFTNIDETSFDITFLVQGGYTYEIVINDSNAIPPTYYTFTVPTVINPNAPVLYTVNTNVFSKVVGQIITPAPNNLIPGHSYEIYINAIDSQNANCPAGPWTVTTLEDQSCPIECAQIDLTVSGEGSITTYFAFNVNFISGPAFPAAYLANIYDSNNNPVIPVDSVLTITPTPPPQPIYPNTTTLYEYNGITAGGDYTVEITSICSFIPYCTGETVTATINFQGPLSCSAPDITLVQVL